jgi:hypothetical protein
MDAKDIVAQFDDAIMNTTIDTIIKIWGESDYQAIADLVQNLKLTLGQLVNNLVRALVFFSVTLLCIFT